MRSERLVRALQETGRGATVTTGRSVPGGGSAPGAGIDGPVVRVSTADADATAHRLRTGTPPIVVRVEDGAVVVDLRTVDPADDAEVRAALCAG